MPAKTSPFPVSTRILVNTAAFVVLVAGLKAAQALLIPLLMAIFFAVLFASPMVWLQRKGLHPLAALAVILVSILALQSLAVAIIGTSIQDFSGDLPEYQKRLKGELQGLRQQLLRFGIDVSEQTLSEMDPNAVVGLVGRLLNGIGALLSNAFLILLLMAFMLIEISTFPVKLAAIFPDNEEPIHRLEVVIANVKRYVVIKTWASLLTGFLIYLWLSILGVNHALALGFVGFLLNYVPSIGSIIAAIPGMAIALIQHGLGWTVLVALGYLAINILIGNILEPRYQGRGAGISTLVVILSLVFWGWVLGPIGMFLSVPLTMMLKIAFDSFEETRWIAVLLGPGTLKSRLPKAEPKPSPVLSTEAPERSS